MNPCQERHNQNSIDLILQPTVKIRDGEVVLSGAVVDDDIVPIKFKPATFDVDSSVDLDPLKNDEILPGMLLIAK